MFETVITISDRWHLSPFDILKEDCEDVFMLLDYFLGITQKENKPEKVNDFNDGFWDF